MQGHRVHPVILEIPEEEETSRNNSLIRKMMKENASNVRYSGGFKNVDSSKVSECINHSLYRPESKQLSEEDLMSRVGIVKKPKYREGEEQPHASLTL